MKFRLIAVAAAAAMLSFGAVAQEKKQESPGAQSPSSATPAGSPSSSGDKPSQRSASAAGGQSRAGGQDQETIKQVQQKLKEQGHDAGAADGIMGPKTQAALKEFQKDKGLKETGQLDRETMAALGVSGSAGAGGSSAKPEKKQ